MTERGSQNGPELDQSTSENFYKQILLHAVGISGSWIESPWPYGIKHSIAISSGTTIYRVSISSFKEKDIIQYRMSAETHSLGTSSKIDVAIDTFIPPDKMNEHSRVKTSVSGEATNDDKVKKEFMNRFLSAKYDPGATHTFETNLKKFYGASRVKRMTR